MKFTIAVIALISLFFWGGARLYNRIVFDKNCGDYLKRAADANTIELAKNELAKAISYIEKNNLKSGYTSILYNTPDEEVGFWYSNIKSSYEELSRVNLNTTTQLEKSNLLIKLRETLLDHGRSQDDITAPKGIELYPNNIDFCLWAVGSLILLIIFGASWCHDNRY